MRMKHFKITFFFFFVLVSSCGLREKRFDGEYISPAQYDFSSPEKLILPQRLDEISGLTISPEDRFWVIEDESSVVFELQWPSKDIIRHSKFAKNMDVEEVLWTGKDLFALKSNGDIYEIKDIFSDSVRSNVYDFPYSGKRDLETLGVFDEHHLILYCKKCKMDEDNEASAFLFNTDTKTYSKAKDFKLKEKPMRKLLDEKDQFKLTIKPSAMSLHPIEDKFYILSSVGKWLLIMSRKGELEHLYRLDPKLFKQAEGMAFNSQGDLFISNEAAGGNANILKFSYRP